MKNIHVVCAIIKQDNQILVAKRLGGEFDGMWEFPGGKIELNESHEEALKREIQEEFEVPIQIDDYLMKVEHQYPTFHLTMECYVCSLLENNITLHDHSDMMWIPLDDSISIQWIPADIQIYDKMIERETMN